MFDEKKRRKELIDREVELYKKEQFIAADKEVEDYYIKRSDEMIALAKRCAEELGAYEHDYHYAKETKGIELAKLEAKIEASQMVIQARQEVINADNNLLKSKDAEIKRLNDIITAMITNQAHTVIQMPKN